MANFTLDINRLRPTIGASILGRMPGDTIRERGFNEDDFAMADLGSSIDEQLTTIGKRVKDALRSGQISPSELGVEHLFVQESLAAVPMGSGGQASVLAKLDFGFATTINGKPYVFAPDTKTKANLNDRSHSSQLYAQGKSIATYFQQESARQNAPANVTRYANAQVSIVQNNLLRVMDAAGNLTISARGQVDAAVQRANHEPDENARLKIYAQLIKQLVIDPSVQAERNNSSAVQVGGQTVSQANRLNFYDPQVASKANEAADYWHLRGRAIQRITGIASPDLVDKLRDTSGMVRKDFFTQEEYDAYRKSRTLMDSWSHEIADAEMKGSTISQAKIDSYAAELRRTLTLKNGTPMAFLPDMRGRQPVTQSGVYPSSLGIVNTAEGWAQIPGTAMYVNKDRVRIASSKQDAMGHPLAVAEFNYERGAGGSHIINGRLVTGGAAELSAIASKADQTWIQWTGGQNGSYAAIDAVRGMLNKKVVAALPGSATEAWQYKYGTALPDDPNAGRTAIQVRVQSMINRGVFPGVYDEEGIMADLAKLIPAIPGMAVFTNSAGQPVARTGREGKYIKDIQKGARNYTLRYAGHEATSPIIAQGAEHPEAVTVLNKVLLSNLEEFSTLRRDLADKFVGTTPYRERIPISSNPNFIPAPTDQIKFGKDASGRNGLMIGWNMQPDGTRKEHYYAVNNWDDITDIQASLVDRKGGQHFVIEGKAHQGILSGGTKSWNQKALWVSGDTGAASDIEATSYFNAGNPILTAVAITQGMYANRADMISADILKMVKTNPEVRDVLAKRNGMTPDQVEHALSIDIAKAGHGGEFITGSSRLTHDAWMLLVDQKAGELTGVQTISKMMSKQRFEALRGSLGVSGGAGQIGVVMPDRFSDTGGDSWSFRDERGNSVISDSDMHKVDVRVRAYVGPIADIFTTTWQWGRGRMSMEEIQDIIQQPTGYDAKTKEAMVNQFMPQALRSGGRSRAGAASVVKAYLASMIPNADLEGLGINTIDFSELQAAMGEDVAGSFYSQINDPANKFIGKYIRLPNGKIAPPLRTHYSMSTFKAGAQANYKNKMTSRSQGRSEQLNRIPELMRKMMSGQIGATDFEEMQSEYMNELYDLSTARGTLKNALSTRYGVEGVYVMDPNLPFNVMVIDNDTATRMYGTTNKDEIAKQARYAFGIRRPDSSSGLTGMLAMKVLTPEEAGRDPRQKGMFISNFVADVLQGDTDGDRMAAFAANVLRTGEPFAGMEDAASSAGFLKRVSYGFSTVLGAKINFKSLNEYQKFVFDLKKAGIGSTELGKSNANLSIDMMGSSPVRNLNESLDDFLARTTKEVSLSEVSKGTMQTEAIGHREMQLGYDLFKRDLPAVLSKLGVDPEKQHEQRTRYHIYQKAVDKIVFSGGLRESIGLMKGFNFGSGIATDQLSPDLGEQPWRQVNMKSGGGSVSFLQSVIRGVLKTHEFRANGSNASWISDVAKAISGDSTDQQMIAAMIASDPTLKDQVALTEGFGGGMEGVLKRAQHYQSAGSNNLDALMEKTADDLSRRISKSVFGDSLRSAAQGKGTIMALALAMATDATQRASGWGGKAGTAAESSLFDLRAEMGDDLLNEYLAAGEYANAEQSMASGRAGKNLAANVMVLGDKLNDKRMAFAKLLGTRAIREAKRQKDATTKRYFKAADGVGDDRTVKINRFEEALLAELQTSNLPTSDWIRFVKEIGQEMKVDSGNMPLYDRAREAKGSGFVQGSRFSDVSGKFAGDFDTPVSQLSPELQSSLAKTVTGAFNAALRLQKGESGSLGMASGPLASARQIAFSELIPDDLSGVSPSSLFSGALKGNFAMPRQSAPTASAPVRPQTNVDTADQPTAVMQIYKKLQDGTLVLQNERTMTPRQSMQKKYGTSIDALRTQEGQEFFGQYVAGQKPMSELQSAIGSAVTIGGSQYSITEPLVKGIEAASSGKQTRVGNLRQDLLNNAMPDSARALFDLTEMANDVKEFGKAVKFATTTSKDFGDQSKTNAQIMRENLDVGFGALKTGKGMTSEDKVQLDTTLKNLMPIVKHLRSTGMQVGDLPQEIRGAVQGAMDWDTASAEAGIFGNRAVRQTASGGLGGRAIRGLTSGSLGELGWTMMNAKRLWGMTGGAVEGRLGEYAKFSAEQQSAMAGLGLTNQFTGAGADIIRQQNNLTDFERGNQRAAWNTYNPLFNMVSGAFGGTDPSRPGFLNYASNNVALGVGLPIAAGFAGSIAQQAGFGTLKGVAGAGASTGIAGALTGVAGKALPWMAAGSLAISAAQAMGEPIREGQDWGSAATERLYDMSWQNRAQYKTDEEYRKSKESQWWYGKTSAAATLGDTISAETDNKVSREMATNIAAMVSKTVGLSYEQLNTEQGRKLVSTLGAYPDQQGMQTRYDLGQSIARLGGVQYGSDQFMGTITKVMDNKNFTEADRLNAQLSVEKLSGLGEMGRTLGADSSWMNNPELLANMTAEQKLRYSKFGSGDRRSWSAVGRRMGEAAGANELITTELDSNLALGTLTTGELSPIARFQGLTARGYSASQAAGMPLQSLASIEFQQRQQRDAQQAFQVAQQYRGLNLNQAQAFGGFFSQGNGQMTYNGSQLTQGQSGYNFAGSFNIQQQQANLGFSSAMAGLALSGGTLGGGYGWKGFNLGQLQGSSLTELGTAGLNYRQSLEAMEIQRRNSGVDRGYAAQDAWTSFNRGNTQLDWSQQDLTTNFSRSIQQLNYSLADLSTNFGRNQTQQGWQKEGIMLQANRSALQFGWGNEDIDEAMRFATGRDRRKLARQRERNTIEYGMGVDSTNRELGHLEERSKWAEEDYQKEVGRTEERRRWMASDFDKELGRIETRRGWLDEDLARALARIGQQAGVEDEAYAKRKKDLKDELDLASKGHANSMAQTKASFALQQSSIDDAIASFKLEAENQKVVLENNQKNWELTTQLSDNYANITAVMQAQADQFAYNFGNADGPVVKALESFKDEWLKATDQIIKNLWQKVSGSVTTAASDLSDYGGR